MRSFQAPRNVDRPIARTAHSVRVHDWGSELPRLRNSDWIYDAGYAVSHCCTRAHECTG